MKKVKQELSIPIIMGGPHITSLPHQLPEYADIGVIGEGEQTLLELMQSYLDAGKFRSSDLAKIHGIVYRKNGKIQSTPYRELISPLDKIPLPDRELLNIQDFLKPPSRWVEMRFHNDEAFKKFLRFAGEYRPRRVKFKEFKTKNYYTNHKNWNWDIG